MADKIQIPVTTCSAKVVTVPDHFKLADNLQLALNQLGDGLFAFSGTMVVNQVTRTIKDLNGEVIEGTGLTVKVRDLVGLIDGVVIGDKNRAQFSPTTTVTVNVSSVVGTTKYLLAKPCRIVGTDGLDRPDFAVAQYELSSTMVAAGKIPLAKITIPSGTTSVTADMIDTSVRAYLTSVDDLAGCCKIAVLKIAQLFTIVGVLPQQAQDIQDLEDRVAILEGMTAASGGIDMKYHKLTEADWDTGASSNIVFDPLGGWTLTRTGEDAAPFYKRTWSTPREWNSITPTYPAGVGEVLPTVEQMSNSDFYSFSDENLWVSSENKLVFNRGGSENQAYISEQFNATPEDTGVTYESAKNLEFSIDMQAAYVAAPFTEINSSALWQGGTEGWEKLVVRNSSLSIGYTGWGATFMYGRLQAQISYHNLSDHARIYYGGIQYSADLIVPAAEGDMVTYKVKVYPSTKEVWFHAYVGGIEVAYIQATEIGGYGSTDPDTGEADPYIEPSLSSVKNVSMSISLPELSSWNEYAGNPTFGPCTIGYGETIILPATATAVSKKLPSSAAIKTIFSTMRGQIGGGATVVMSYSVDGGSIWVAMEDMESLVDLETVALTPDFRMKFNISGNTSIVSNVVCTNVQVATDNSVSQAEVVAMRSKLNEVIIAVNAAHLLEIELL